MEELRIQSLTNLQFMSGINVISLFLLTVLIPLFPLEAANEYTVKFSGIQKDTHKLLKEASQLIANKDKPPKTKVALRQRAESDIPNLVKALHSQAYYNAKVEFAINFSSSPFEIVFQIDPGLVYPFGGYRVLPESLNIQPHHLGVSLNKPAYPKDILDAEEVLSNVLASKGYPLAQIKDREVTADQKSKEIFVTVQVDPGPLTYFGRTAIEGNCGVCEALIRKKIYWHEGQQYDPVKIDCTFNALEAAGVFSSINITHAEEPDEDNKLPMTIQVSEGNQRTIGFGLSYSTQRGGGFTAQWDHRNIRGMGEKLSADANVLQYFQEATVTYVKPDFGSPGQDLLWIADWEHDDTEAFEKTSYSISGILERQLNDRTRVSLGGTYTHLRNEDADNEGSFNLLKAPFQLKWTNVDDPLDPTCGNGIYLKTVPTIQLLDSQFAYIVTTLTGSIYRPLCRNRRFILAAKASFGTILGSRKKDIPSSERFYAGSENTLRGYKYYTVSPLDKDNDPKGGRSMMIYTLEGRWHASEKWGSVLFYDVGNVYSTPLPQLDKEMLQSIGLGIRYYTPVGPLRLDIAFPLNRRKNVDNSFQIYFSVGQAF
ncbi:MAG: Translocation and assembly module TamA [Chlamydiae bacterium]|nr:Translocation and assembly module TamA [Chlamydiota bacterium]